MLVSRQRVSHCYKDIVTHCNRGIAAVRIPTMLCVSQKHSMHDRQTWEKGKGRKDQTQADHVRFLATSKNVASLQSFQINKK